MRIYHEPKQLIVAFIFLYCSCAVAGKSTVISEDWRFNLGPGPVAAQEVQFDDSAWRVLRLPHDWAIEGPFEADGDGGTGRLPWKNEGWYRHVFTLPGGDGSGRVYFDFDGVMAFPKVYINGKLAGEWDYGYTPFRIDATPFVKWGESNVIAVHVDTHRWGSRWYPGAGIYRKVAMTIADPVHFAYRGIQVRTNGNESRNEKPDAASVTAIIENHGSREISVVVKHVLTNPLGVAVASGEDSIVIPANGESTNSQTLQVPDALLWDVGQPNLYVLNSSIEANDKELDSNQTRIGFRTFEFTADDGFHLNGRRVQLRGINNHHDLGPLGSAFNRRAAQRQLEIMKEMGANALRTSHNPPAPEVLDLADEMGFVVWDEAFDKYAWTAGRPDLEPPLPAFSQRQITAMIERDFNHPSVVVWSTGNEVWGDEEHEGINPERVKMMADYVRDLDLSRPVGMSCHIPSLVDGKNFAALDLTGWNYSRRYANYRAQYPDRPVIYSESASTFSTRGYYDPDLPSRPIDYSDNFQVSSYDLNAAPWSDIPDAEFRLMEQDLFVAGEFVWTGFDYLGEPTPFAEEARSSYFGIVDLCGFTKDRFYLYRSHWRADEPTVHLLPHWNWPNRIGLQVPVFVYTNGDSAELFLNGRSLGVRRKGQLPERPPNLAAGNPVAASSAEPATPAEAASDADLATEWHAASAEPGAWWQLDLGSPQTVGQISLDTLQKENNYAYVIETSVDGVTWNLLVEQPTRPWPIWNGPTRFVHQFQPVDTRYLRLTFTEAKNDAPLGLKEFQVYAGAVEDDYYDVTYDYRLRWNDVAYKPGELLAVAYKDGQRIGEARVETTGAPASLRLSVDREVVSADGEDLAFITVEALDAQGRSHPLAENLVHFQVEGAGMIAAVGNGNPLSFEPFQSDRRQLFYGKALLIIRPIAGEGGTIFIKAVSPELKSATLEIEAQAALK